MVWLWERRSLPMNWINELMMFVTDELLLLLEQLAIFLPNIEVATKKSNFMKVWECRKHWVAYKDQSESGSIEKLLNDFKVLLFLILCSTVVDKYLLWPQDSSLEMQFRAAILVAKDCLSTLNRSSCTTLFQCFLVPWIAHLTLLRHWWCLLLVRRFSWDLTYYSVMELLWRTIPTIGSYAADELSFEVCRLLGWFSEVCCWRHFCWWSFFDLRSFGDKSPNPLSLTTS